MKSEEEKAISYFQSKNYAAALRCFLHLLATDNTNDKFFVYIGNCYDALKQKEEALNYYQKALKINKKSDIAAVNSAIIYSENKDYSQAQKFATKALKINKNNPSALSILGNICYYRQQYDKALKYYLQALAVQNNFYTAVLNTASIYFDKKDYISAYFYGKRAVKISPDSIDARKLLSSICIELGYFDEVIYLLSDISAKGSKDCWVYNLLSQAFQQKKEYLQAIEFGWQAVVFSKGSNDQHINFGYLLYEIAIDSPSTDILSYVHKWQEQYKINPIVQHMSNALLNVGHVSQISQAYIQNIFDVFADDFENVLEGLDYMVPSLMEEALDNLAKNIKLKKMRILDAGCGTGLCGKFLKKYAKFRGLDGVDLSENMLKIARQKKLYTHLYQQELKEFLSSHRNTYDLINGADVLTYFGALEDVFNLMHTSLKSGGRILFSISENNCTQEDYFLHMSGRFLHNKNYIEKLLRISGFFIEKLTRVKLRNEGDKEVYGWLIMGKRVR